MHARSKAVLLSLGVLTASALAFGHLSAGCVFNSAEDCVEVLGFDGCKTGAGVTTSSVGGSGGGGSTTRSTSTSSAMMTTGGGGTGGCKAASDCPDPPAGPCASLGKATCNNGVCGLEYTAGPSPSQVYGNCKTAMCDQTGTLTQVDDTTDVFDDGNPCTDDVCMNGKPKNTLAKGKACSLGAGTGVCVADAFYGLPSCVECDPDDPNACMFVPGTTCVSNKCAPSHCSNGIKDSGETGTDCGGTTGCPRCGTNGGCMTYKDCASGICTNNVCVAPSCMDGKQNGFETDIDCGGATCPLCADTLGCSAPADCVSGVCKPTSMGLPDVCVAPSCTDGVQNGDEAGIDCGGTTSACPPCP
jgi:hypothetical protein